VTKPSDQVENDAARDADLHSGVLPDGERREALKKMAKYSNYSAPALFALMNSAKAVAPAVSGPPDL
jgi:hypothetical protein